MAMTPTANKQGWLEQSALDSITREASSKAPLETGGILMGYLANSTVEPIVLIATGPGPNAVHCRQSYSPDQEYDERHIADLYAKSGRRLTYLGDWHSHPLSSHRLSMKDRWTLKHIAKCPAARIRNPIMLIVADCCRWSPAIWQGSLAGGKDWFAKMRIRKLKTILFKLPAGF